MSLPMMVLPLTGGSPSSVLVIAFPDGIMLIYGESCKDGDEDFFTVDKGNVRRFGFDKNPSLRGIVNDDGTLKLYKLTDLIP